MCVRSACRGPGQDGVALGDVLLACALFSVLAGMALPAAGNLRQRVRGESAVRRLVAECRQARVIAARRSATVALRFEVVGDRLSWRPHVDGDGDGVRSADVGAGVDPPIGPATQLDAEFPGVLSRIATDVPAVDGTGSLAAGADPLRLGSGNSLSFSPLGTTSGGSVYLAGPDGRMYAVRVLAATGRVRALRYNPDTRRWDTL
jgi:type II secretory pathway pseudopilin PulG